MNSAQDNQGCSSEKMKRQIARMCKAPFTAWWKSRAQPANHFEDIMPSLWLQVLENIKTGRNSA
jgi:hypothetical protein